MTGSAFAFRGFQQDVSGPLSAASFSDGLRFGPGQPDAQDLGSPLVVGEWWSSSAWCHDANISGHIKLADAVDSSYFWGHNKDMNTAAQTITADNRTYTFIEGYEYGDAIDTLGSIHGPGGAFFGFVVRNNATGVVCVMRSGRVSPRLDQAVRTLAL